MRGNFRGFAAAVAAAASAQTLAVPAQAADEARTFAPSSEWALGNDDESCWIERRFGGSDNGLSFRLQVFGPRAGAYDVVMRGKPLPQRDAGILEFEARFNPDDKALQSAGVLAKSGGMPLLRFRTSLEPASVVEARRSGDMTPIAVDEAREAAIDEFVIRFSRGKPLALRLGSMREPLARLRQCTAGLVAGWGLDPTVQQSLSRPPAPTEQGKWLGPGTYPWAYLRAYRSALVHLRLMTDERGTATGCAVQSPRTGGAAGVIACREIVKNARFEPALDADGKPVASYFNTSVFYRTKRRNGSW